MTDDGSVHATRIRVAEVIAASCLATDLGMGFPFEHGLHATLMAMRLADKLDVDPETATQTYYVSLLMYSGCTTDAEIRNRIFRGGMTQNVTPVQFGSPLEVLPGLMRGLASPGSPLPQRAYEIATGLPQAARFRKPHFTALCEVAAMLADRLGLPPSVRDLFTLLTERWDGKGVLRRAEGDEIPLPIRIVHVARDAAYQRLIGGDEHAIQTVRDRAGHAFDPRIANLFAGRAADILSAADVPGSAWESALDAEPQPRLVLEGEAIDRALSAMGDFADLASPSLAGHSAGVAQLAKAAARVCDFDPAAVDLVGRAGHVHDVGRAGVHPRTWQNPGALTADEWEQVRLHPYHTQRVLDRSQFLSSLAAIACAHHERVDGSGYHRGETAMTLPPPARLLAVADAFHAMTEPRAHRPALSKEQAAETIGEEARSGRLDSEMVSAVLEAAGLPAPQVERPAGLTEREAEVIRLVARGLQTKQIARALDISIKTADRHIQNAYRKISVSTRAAATLFAMEHGLVP
jgi:HD-GYP domain-containing protein (c-di-GMP phosphodiesterase class II)